MYFEQKSAKNGTEEEEGGAEVRVGVKYKLVAVSGSILTDSRRHQLFQLAARVLPGEEGEEGGEEYFATCAPEVVSVVTLAEHLTPGSKVRVNTFFL